MDFTAAIDIISYGRGYEKGFRAGWEAHAELIESRQRWEENGPAVATDLRDSVHGDR